MAVESTIFEHYAPVGEIMRILQGNYFAEVGGELDEVEGRRMWMVPVRLE
jgi:hypothetical protein